jgi:hypothetical protein
MSLLNSIFIPIIVAAITGYFSSKIAYINEVKQTVYEKRQEFYTDIFSIL